MSLDLKAIQKIREKDSELLVVRASGHAFDSQRQYPAFELLNEELKILLKNGFKEIVLTGVDLTSYGNDLYKKPKLGKLIKDIFKNVKNLERLRLSSIDAIEIDNDLIEMLNYEERLMPHLHLSIQSGDNLILKRMKRRHSREDVINLCNKLMKKR